MNYSHQQKKRKPKPASGQSLAEYGLILALIGVVAISALQLLGSSVQSELTGLAGTIKGVNTSSSATAAAANGCSGSGCAAGAAQGW